MTLIISLFFLTALLYSSVGFGGGSTYTALLVLTGTDYRILPTISLMCNIIVASGGAWRFYRAGHVTLSRLWPFILTSVPMAWLGGRILAPEALFIGVLAVSLLAAGVRMLWLSPSPERFLPDRLSLFASLTVGCVLGFISGLVGIGGGIFLAPILYMMRWGSAHAIAGACSIFILVNSMSGLTGQLVKLEDQNLLQAVSVYWPLLPAVLIGGQLGAHLGALKFSESVMRYVTAVLVLYVAVRLLFRWCNLVIG